MTRWKCALPSVAIWALSALAPATAFAQSGIAGTASDTSTARLPGVTVEASSPALIEKVRVVVTDNEGRYNIVALRPGVYTVSFSLPGFATVRRERIELPAGFTATVNAEMQVGSLEETITVTGDSPVVDVQNVVTQRTVSAEVISALPTSRTFQTIGSVTPGIVTSASVGSITQDVGGSAGDKNSAVAIHGGRTGDSQILMDGLYFNNTNTTNLTGIIPDMGTVREVVYQTGSITAEYRTGGVHINLIPKEGGNRFSGAFFGAYSDSRFQTDNSAPELVARGLGSLSSLDRVWDTNATLGGPIKREKLWFLVSARYWGLDNVVAGGFYNATPESFAYTPDLSRPLIDDTWLTSTSGRVTWQVTPKNKISFWAARNKRCFCNAGGISTIAPEAGWSLGFPESHMETVTWTAPLTNRLMVEASFVDNQLQISYDPTTPDLQDGRIGITEQSTGLRYRSRVTGYANNDSTLLGYRAAVSYVSGSHAIKVGTYLQHGHVWSESYFFDSNGGKSGAMAYTLLNGLPRSVTLFTTPYESTRNLNATLGIFAQDQWTLKRMTFNIGVRYDYLNGSIPETSLPAARFVGARQFDEIKDVPNWHDLVPRLGVAYDIFGTGKTAIKASIGRYVAAETTQFVSRFDPVTTSTNQATRTWNDTNGNFEPDCDFTRPALNGECGPLNPSTFGQQIITTRVDDDVRAGFGKRGFNVESMVGVQHELIPRVAVEATYIRRSYGNFLVTDNLAVAPSDYDSYCITAPSDPRLPGGGGNEICGLFDINPSVFGRVDNLVTFASNYGDQSETWNGIDLTVNARLAGGVTLAGGSSTGRRVSDNCDVIGKVDNPATTVDYLQPASPTKLYCRQQTTQTQVKFLGVFPLPWGIVASGTYQQMPGAEISASYPATNAQIAPSLGRNLSSGATGTAVIQLIQPGSTFESTIHQFDARFAKVFRLGQSRLRANFDLYNLFNASSILQVNNSFGPRWLQPLNVLPGRLLKFSAQFDF